VTMRVLLLHGLPVGEASEVVTVNESYGRRLIEQGQAIPAERDPAPRKADKREAAPKQKDGE
jgi:ribosomal protein L9